MIGKNEILKVNSLIFSYILELEDAEINDLIEGSKIISIGDIKEDAKQELKSSDEINDSEQVGKVEDIKSLDELNNTEELKKVEEPNKVDGFKKSEALKNVEIFNKAKKLKKIEDIKNIDKFRKEDLKKADEIKKEDEFKKSEEIKVVEKLEEVKEDDIIGETINNINKFTTRKEANLYLNQKIFTVKLLKIIAKKSDIYLKSKSKKAEIIDKIIEATVGASLKHKILKEG